MKVERQIAVAELVIGALWLLLTGGCTAQIALQRDTWSNGVFATLGLWIGAGCSAPAVYLLHDGVRKLLGRRTAAWVVALAALAALTDGFLILRQLYPTAGSFGERVTVLVFVLFPAVIYAAAAWSLRHAAASESQRKADRPMTQGDRQS